MIFNNCTSDKTFLPSSLTFKTEGNSVICSGYFGSCFHIGLLTVMSTSLPYFPVQQVLLSYENLWVTRFRKIQNCILCEKSLVCCFGGFLAAINCQRPAEDAKKSTRNLTLEKSRNLSEFRFRGLDIPSASRTRTKLPRGNPVGHGRCKQMWSPNTACRRSKHP